MDLRAYILFYIKYILYIYHYLSFCLTGLQFFEYQQGQDS